MHWITDEVLTLTRIASNGSMPETLVWSRRWSAVLKASRCSPLHRYLGSHERRPGAGWSVDEASQFCWTYVTIGATVRMGVPIHMIRALNFLSRYRVYFRSPIDPLSMIRTRCRRRRRSMLTRSQVWVQIGGSDTGDCHIVMKRDKEGVRVRLGSRERRPRVRRRRKWSGLRISLQRD